MGDQSVVAVVPIRWLRTAVSIARLQVSCGISPKVLYKIASEHLDCARTRCAPAQSVAGDTRRRAARADQPLALPARKGRMFTPHGYGSSRRS